MKIFKAAAKIIDPKDQRRLGLLIFLVLFQSMLEMLGLAAIYFLLNTLGGSAQAQSTGIGIVSSLSDIILKSVDKNVIIASVVVFFMFKTVSFVLMQRWQLQWVWRAWARSAENQMGHYLCAPYTFHLKTNSTILLSRLEQLSRFYRGGVMPAVELITELVMVIIICSTLFVLSWQVMLLATFLLGGVAILYERLVSRSNKKWGKVAANAHGELFKAAGQALGGVRDIKLFQVPAEFEKRISTATGNSGTAAVYSNFFQSMPRSLLEFVFITTLVVVIFSVPQDNPMELMPLAGTFAIAGMRLMPSLFRVMNKANSIGFIVPLLEQLEKDLVVTGIESEKWSHDGNIGPLAFQREIRAEGLGCRFEGTDAPALSGIDLVIRKGESVAFVGGSGAGKTTLANLLIGLYLPTAGRVAVDGVSVADNLAAWRLKVAYVPQDPFLTDDSLRRNIAFGMPDEAIDEAQLRHAVEQARLQSFVEALPDGLDTVVGERGMRLSGGQKQRIAIARALYFRREVLVLDEATAALDAKTEAEITEAIDSLRHHLTMITIAHRLSTVQSCDRIYFLKNGAIDRVGTFDELLRGHADFKEMAAHMGMVAPDAAQ